MKEEEYPIKALSELQRKLTSLPIYGRDKEIKKISRNYEGPEKFWVFKMLELIKFRQMKLNEFQRLIELLKFEGRCK